MGAVHCSCVQREAECDSVSPGVITVYDDGLPTERKSFHAEALEQSPEESRRWESDATLPGTFYGRTEAEQATEDAAKHKKSEATRKPIEKLEAPESLTAHGDEASRGAALSFIQVVVNRCQESTGDRLRDLQVAQRC